jgi:hypothetical protein
MKASVKKLLLAGSGIRTITKDLARDILEIQPDGWNRQLRDWWVRNLADAMNRHEFYTTGTLELVAEDGRIIDAQHRLHALLASKCESQEFNVVVVDGLTEEEILRRYQATDIGRPRSICDTVRLDDGSRVRSKAQQCINVLAFIGTGKSVRRMAWLLEPYCRAFYETTCELLDYCGTDRAKLSAASVRAMFVLRAVLEPKRKAKLFSEYRNMVLDTLDLEARTHRLRSFLLGESAYRASGTICTVWHATDSDWNASFCRKIKTVSKHIQIIRNAINSCL